MNSKSKNSDIILEPRKIVKSYLGIFLSCLHTFIFAVSIGLAIVFNTSGYQGLDLAEEFICWAIGLVPRIVKTRGSDYGSVAYVLYLVACLLQMYIPLRALIQPSFLAGKPDINSFWPLVVALILRSAIEIIYIIMLGSSIVIHAILMILINAVYSYAIYQIYSVDDDNLPVASDGKSRATNLKPWQFEVEEQLPKYHDPKK